MGSVDKNGEAFSLKTPMRGINCGEVVSVVDLGCFGGTQNPRRGLIVWLPRRDTRPSRLI